jgi:pimeloyl-ACP methyl ester carboxylesterase
MAVINMDMPLYGENALDLSDTLKGHEDFIRFDDGSQSTIALFLLPVKVVVDMIYSTIDSLGYKFKLLMIGRSGGGWTTTLYGTIDPRVHLAVPVAGLVPLSMRLAADSGRDIGDYEQFIPDLYDVVTYEDMMKATGLHGSLFIYNAQDPCCFSVQKSSDLVQYLNDAARRYGKRIDVWIDEDNLEHSISERGYEVLGDFLDSMQFWSSMPENPQ